MKAYDTLSEAIADLQQQGYISDLSLQSTCLVCGNTGTQLNPDDFHIDAVYRFEGDTDPGDENILYAVSSEKYNLKGLLVNAYGVYEDDVTQALVAKLRV
jgi:hypothetical protein